MALFRDEVIAEQKIKQYGSILIVQSPALIAYTAAIIVAVLVVAWFVKTFDYSEKVSLSGVLVPKEGFVYLYPAQVSTISKTKVKDGQHVRKGDVIFSTTPAVRSKENAITRRSSTGTANQSEILVDQIRAPQDGTVTIYAAQGELVQPTTLTAIITPDASELIAELYADSKKIQGIHLGDTVAIHYRAYTRHRYGVYTAHILSISTVPVPLSNTLAGAVRRIGTEHPMYRLRAAIDSADVEFNGHHIPLAAGLEFDASIVRRRQKLYQYIAETLFGSSRKN